MVAIRIEPDAEAKIARWPQIEQLELRHRLAQVSEQMHWPWLKELERGRMWTLTVDARWVTLEVGNGGLVVFDATD